MWANRLFCPHIGNLRTFAHADSIRKSIENKGEIVKHVINITDIDDKIMDAIGIEIFDFEKHLPIIKEFTEPFIQKFKSDLLEIGVDISRISFVNVSEGQKMSKSLGNQYTLADIKSRGYTGKDLRNLFEQYSYFNNLDFTFEKLEAARVKSIDIEVLKQHFNALRSDLRAKKNYEVSDSIRDILTKNNIQIQDK